MSKPKGYVSKFVLVNHSKVIEIYLKEIDRIKKLNLYDYVREQYYIDFTSEKSGYAKDTTKRIILNYNNSLKKQSIF